jgi:hypothetical protein
MTIEEIRELKTKLEKEIAEQLNLFQECTHCSIVQAHSAVPCSFGSYPSDKNKPVPLDFHIHIII